MKIENKRWKFDPEKDFQNSVLAGIRNDVDRLISCWMLFKNVFIFLVYSFCDGKISTVLQLFQVLSILLNSRIWNQWFLTDLDYQMSTSPIQFYSNESEPTFNEKNVKKNKTEPIMCPFWTMKDISIEIINGFKLVGLDSCLSFITHVIMNAYYNIISMLFVLSNFFAFSLFSFYTFFSCSCRFSLQFSSWFSSWISLQQ